MVLFDRFGERKITYAKVHTCDFDVERNLVPGKEFYVTTLDTRCDEVKVGAMICYDREFPESARILMLQGAELILCPKGRKNDVERTLFSRGREDNWDADELYAQLDELPPERAAEVLETLRRDGWQFLDAEAWEWFLLEWLLEFEELFTCWRISVWGAIGCCPTFCWISTRRTPPRITNS